MGQEEKEEKEEKAKDKEEVMALSDCDKCWETPCRCGWEYRDWSVESRIQLAAAVLGLDKEDLQRLYVPDPHPKKNS